MKELPRVVLTGGTGFIGRRLLSQLVTAGYAVSVVTRTPEVQRTARAGVDYVRELPDLARHQAVVHLAGEPLFGARWTAELKRELRASRVDSTQRLVDAMARAAHKPKVFVCASAIGYYGDRGDEVLTEESAPGQDFLAELCRDWEGAARAAEALGVRVVRVRIGVVLGPKGGALAQMLTPFKLGLGGRIGNGRQWFSWVHLRDLADLFVHALREESVRGALNGTAPEPVTNAAFTKALGRALHRPTLFPVPPLALRLRFGEAAEVLTASQRCAPAAALASGFRFRFAALEPALQDILG